MCGVAITLGCAKSVDPAGGGSGSKTSVAYARNRPFSNESKTAASSIKVARAVFTRQQPAISRSRTDLENKGAPSSKGGQCRLMTSPVRIASSNEIHRNLPSPAGLKE